MTIHADRWAALAMVLLFVLSVGVILERFKVTTDLGVFLPPAKSKQQQMFLHQVSHGLNSSMVFVSLSGVDPLVLSNANKSLTKYLRQSQEFEGVHNGDLKISESDIEFVFRNRYLLTPAEPEGIFSVESLRRSLKERLDGLVSSRAHLEKKYLTKDPTGEFLRTIENWIGGRSADAGGVKHHGVWFSEDQLRSLLIVELQDSAFDMDAYEADINLIKNTFRRLVNKGVKMDLTGSPVFAVANRDRIRGDTRFLTILATICITLFLIVVLGSIRLCLLVFLPLVFGVLAGIATVLTLFGAIHGITLAFGITLTGVAIDYPIHYFSHLNKYGESKQPASISIWPTLFLGLVTTIIAYAVFVLTGFSGLQQLGLFTIVGLASAAATTRWLLPLIVSRNLSIRGSANVIHRFFERAAKYAPKLLVWFYLLVAFAGTYLAFTERPLKNHDLESLSTTPNDLLQMDYQLRRDLGVWSGGKLLIVVADDIESVLRSSESIAEQLRLWVDRGKLAGYEMVAKYLPSLKRQGDKRDALPTKLILQQRLNLALKGSPFKQNTFVPFLEDVDATRQLSLITLSDLAQTQLRSKLRQLLEKMKGKGKISAQSWVASIFLYGVVDDSLLSSLSGHREKTEVVYLDLKKESVRIMQIATNHVMDFLIWALLLIYLVLALFFRSLYSPLRILIPTLASVIIVTTILVYSGTSLTIFHLISLLLVVGLGLDYSLFFRRLDDYPGEWSSTFRSLWVCCSTTVLVFGILMLSHTPPLQAIGQTVALGAIFCLVFSAICASPSELRSANPQRRKP